MPYKFDPNSESDRTFHEEHKKLIQKDENRKQVESIPIDRNKVGFQFKNSKSKSKWSSSNPKVKKMLDKSTLTGMTSKLNSKMTKDMADTINMVRELDVDQTIMASEISDVFGKMIEELNTTYGFKITVDLDSFSKSLESIIEPKKKKVLELFISEAYSRARAILYMMYLNAICSLSAQLLAPDVIQSQSMEYSDKFLILNQLFVLMENMNTIYTQVNIPDAELKLERLAEKADSNSRNNTPSDPTTRSFLRDLSKTVRSLKK